MSGVTYNVVTPCCLRWLPFVHWCCGCAPGTSCSSILCRESDTALKSGALHPTASWTPSSPSTTCLTTCPFSFACELTTRTAGAVSAPSRTRMPPPRARRKRWNVPPSQPSLTVGRCDLSGRQYRRTTVRLWRCTTCEVRAVVLASPLPCSVSHACAIGLRSGSQSGWGGVGV